jgi:hypothetical protein
MPLVRERDQAEPLCVRLANGKDFKECSRIRGYYSDNPCDKETDRARCSCACNIALASVVGRAP